MRVGVNLGGARCRGWQCVRACARLCRLKHMSVDCTQNVWISLCSLSFRITLGLLYESLPESQGLNELVLQVLIIMLDLRVWRRALELYGPAPPRTYAPPPARTLTIEREHASRHHRRRPGSSDPAVGSDRTKSISPRKFDEVVDGSQQVSSGAVGTHTSLPRRTSQTKAVAHDPSCCIECNRSFDTDETIQECDCGAVTVRYRESCVASSDFAGPSCTNRRFNRARANTF